MNEFGNRLKMLREKQDMSLQDLAIKLDIAKSLLWRYETGKSEPGLTILIGIANYFGVTLDWIAGNGNINDVQYTCKKEYIDTINKCISNDISAEKLDKIIDIIKE